MSETSRPRPKEVRVTPSQVDAARLIVARDTARGKVTRLAIRMIADARRSRNL